MFELEEGQPGTVLHGKAGQVKVAMWIIAVLSTLFLTVDKLGGIIEWLKSI
ncbi:hypothetical protein ACFL3G_10850 [Planctomycetota bacterium]